MKWEDSTLDPSSRFRNTQRFRTINKMQTTYEIWMVDLNSQPYSWPRSQFVGRCWSWRARQLAKCQLLCTWCVQHNKPPWVPTVWCVLFVSQITALVVDWFGAYLKIKLKLLQKISSLDDQLLVVPCNSCTLKLVVLEEFYSTNISGQWKKIQSKDLNFVKADPCTWQHQSCPNHIPCRSLKWYHNPNLHPSFSFPGTHQAFWMAATSVQWIPKGIRYRCRK